MAKKDYSKLNKEELLEVIKNLESKKKYGLVWDEEKVPEKVVVDCQHQLPVLKEVKDKEIITDPSQPTHILIEGDNYHALSVLNYTHKGKIDLIYIDPPYNTGNKDFVYNDCYVEKEDTWRHSKWLNFMSKRLELAKELLTEKGVIFISIDEHEYANLKIICDGLFGELNIDTLIWRKNGKQGNTKKINRIKNTHEYILVAYKNKNKTFFGKVKLLPNWKGKKTNPDKDLRGNWESGVICRDEENSNTKSENYYVVRLPSGRELKREFYFKKDQFNEYLKENKIYFPKDGDGIPRLKIFEKEEQEYYFDSIIDEMGTFTDAKQEIANILGNTDVFDTPKPKKLIKEICRVSTKKDSIILDFFAGSGTSAISVFELNQEDFGNRKVIVCTNNENNNGNGKIAEDICFPRIKKSINGYNNLKEEQIEGLGGNLKYFKTAFVKNRPNKDQLKIEITKQCTEMLCLKEGIFNLKTTTKDYKIFEQNDRFMAVFYDFANASLNDLKKQMNALKGEKVLYCFTLLEKLETMNFKGWKDIKLEPIPQKILELYLEIFKN
jgi:adenine-specific DNA-methyltransferase